jgi:hypothetical protein
VDEQRLWETLAHVNSWIRFADAKAGGLLTLGGAFGGALLLWLADEGSTAREAADISIVLLMVGIVSAFGVAVNALLCLAPLIEPADSEYQTNVFFVHIARHTSRASFAQAIHEGGPGRVSEDLIHQVFENSRIATYKYKKVERASQFTAAMLLISGAGWSVEILSRLA